MPELQFRPSRPWRSPLSMKERFPMRRLARLCLPVVAASSLTLTAAACDEGDVVTLPSGCVRIRPDIGGQANWVWYPQPFGSDAETIYDNGPNPAVFVGVQALPHRSYIYNAPTGANQWERAVNCSSSEGASQG